MMLTRNGGWRAGPCFEKYACVCEKGTTTTEEYSDTAKYLGEHICSRHLMTSCQVICALSALLALLLWGTVPGFCGWLREAFSDIAPAIFFVFLPLWKKQNMPAPRVEDVDDTLADQNTDDVLAQRERATRSGLMYLWLVGFVVWAVHCSMPFIHGTLCPSSTVPFPSTGPLTLLHPGPHQNTGKNERMYSYSVPDIFGDTRIRFGWFMNFINTAVLCLALQFWKRNQDHQDKIFSIFNFRFFVSFSYFLMR